MKYQLHECCDEQYFYYIWNEWEKLCDNYKYSTPFQYPQWIVPWWKNFGGSTLKIITVFDENRLIAFAPFFIYLDSDGSRKCCLVGTGISDYLDIPVSNGSENICYSLIIDYLVSLNSQWDKCDLQEIRENSFFYKEIVNKRLAFSISKCSLCNYKMLSDPDKIIYTISKKLRGNLRRAEKKLICHGDLQLRDEPECNINRAFERLVFLHTNRWEQKASSGVLCDPSILQFHVQSLSELAKKKMVNIFSLYYKKDVIAVYYVLTNKKVAYAYLGGFDSDIFESSPGSLALYYVMRSLSQRGFEKIDFLRGEEDYKKYWLPSTSINLRIIIK